MSDDRSIIDKVRREKEEFEAQSELENQTTQEELVRKDKLLPVSQIGQKAVLQMFKDYYAPEALEHMSIEPGKAVALAGALKTLSRNIIKASNPIMCLGHKCYSGERCPIQKAGVAPIGHSCLSKGSKISLVNYEKNIEDVQIGEKTISFDDTNMVEDRVKNVKYMGKKKTYIIKTHRGHEIECTSDHLFYSLCGGLHKRNKISKKNKSILPVDLPHKWMSIDNGLQVGSKIAVPISTNNFSDVYDNILIGKLFGYFITDGNSTKYQTFFTNTNIKYIEEYEEICKSLGGLTNRYQREARIDKNGVNHKISWNVTSLSTSRKKEGKDVIFDIYAEGDLINIKGENKRIPDYIMFGTKDVITSFINRFWSGDGCIVTRKNKVCLSAVGLGDGLFKQLRILLWKIGVHSKIYVIPKKNNNYRIDITDRLSIRNFFGFVGLIYGKEVKSIEAININNTITDKFTHTENNILWDYINIIEEKGINDVYDIETEKYHNYIANGIVVHNCPIELMLIDQWEDDYINDLGVDKQSKIELDLVRDMVESDLIDWRASHEIAKGGLFDWNAIGMSEDGKPIYRKEEAVAIGIKLKFKARKDRIREDLMATRKMRAKFGLAKTIDPSKFASALQDRYNAIKNATVVENTVEEMKEEHE